MSQSISSSNGKSLADYEAVFAALDSAARRQILLILHMRGDEMSSGEIAERFSCSWPTTSRHLRKLESAGLVTVERSGRGWIYRLDHERLGVVGEWLGWFEHGQAGDAAAKSSTRAKGPRARARRATA
ncbi:MAG TPA: metalloregulator ArsR/SmtB family transcription factor [Gammaproteobacteria bacterium]|nr:metalloregulator ArsR/SmtB family transcription factor [Gammaproteobacteria bacterium]